MRSRAQITIPSSTVKNLDIKEGDKFEVIEKDGGIFLRPVVVYPKREMERLAQVIREAEEGYSNGDLKSYDAVERMLKDLGINSDED